MAGRTVICAICGQSFTAPAPRTKYCSPKCRAIGANQARKEWETNTDYKGKQRLKMSARRQEEQGEIQRHRQAEQAAAAAKNSAELKAKRKEELKELRKKAKAGDLEAQQELAAEKGDTLEYWRLYKERILQSEREFNYTGLHMVGGIDIHLDNFEQLVVDQIENKERKGAAGDEV